MQNEKLKIFLPLNQTECLLQKRQAWIVPSLTLNN